MAGTVYWIRIIQMYILIPGKAKGKISDRSEFYGQGRIGKYKCGAVESDHVKL